MKIGILMVFHEATARPGPFAAELERCGFESIWVPEHPVLPVNPQTPFPQGGPIPDVYAHMSDQVICLGMAAANTTTLRLGTGVTLVPEHNPLVHAKQVATLDGVSAEAFDAALGGVSYDPEVKRHDGGVAMFAHARLEGRESALQRLAHALALRADIGRDELRRRPDLVLEFGEARDDRLARRGFALHHGRRDGPALTGDDFLEGGELFGDERARALAALRNLRAGALAVLG